MSLASWQDRIIYFVLIDRFYNGDKSNDDFGQGEYHPKDDNCFKGGDLRGIIQKLPFIRRMGFDALWLTPPVHNQWINPYIPVRGYHGYWAYDFTRVDPHFGTMADYKELVAKAHALGIKVIQDIVVNHTGNYFTVKEKGYDPRNPERNWEALAGSYPPAQEPKAPRDPVFCMNNPNLQEHKAAAVYHFTPNISDYKDRRQTLTWSMGDLDDINLHTPLAADRMREIYRHWIEEAGVDAFRVDSVYYTPEDFYEGFLHDPDPKNPGIKAFARRRGKTDFLVFGEVWSYDYRALNRYILDGKARRLDSAIDLPLNEALTQTFFRKAPTKELARQLEVRRHNRPLWVNFLDNHDIERMNSRAAWPAVRQSLVALFTLPGIPCIYYGTEAGFKASRQTMFRQGHFNEKSRHHLFLKELIRLRKRHPALSRGSLEIEKSSPTCGILSYTRSYQNERMLMVFNTSPDRIFYRPGKEAAGLQPLLSSSGANPTASKGGWILPPESYMLLRARKSAPIALNHGAGSAIRLNVSKRRCHKGKCALHFKIKGNDPLKSLSLLCDDNYARRIEIARPRDTTFRFDTAEFGNGDHTLSLLARTRSGRFISSDAAAISVQNPYHLLSRATVPRENKAGIRHRIHPPADPSYGKQLSMENVSIYSTGKDLSLSLRMAAVTSDWNPPNGYDHVYFSIFFDFPGRPGKRFFPKLNYSEKGFEFNAGFLLYGWESRSFGAKDSTPDSYGAPWIGEVTQKAVPRDKTITFTFSNKVFGSLKTLSGMNIFISTWDGFLGDFRTISDRKEDWSFYTFDCKNPGGLPKVFDHVKVKLP